MVSGFFLFPVTIVAPEYELARTLAECFLPVLGDGVGAGDAPLLYCYVRDRVSLVRDGSVEGSLPRSEGVFRSSFC